MADILGERSYDINKIESARSFFKTLFELNDIPKEHCLPAIVESYDRNTHRASVRPLVANLHRQDGELISIKREAVDVPVLNVCNGGYLIDIPIYVGDTGMIVACDRNCDDAMSANSSILSGDDSDKTKNVGQLTPSDLERNRFLFGFFVPNSWANHSEEFFQDNMAIKVYDRDVYPTYDPAKQYKKYDKVSYSSSQGSEPKNYVCILDCVGILPTEKAYWALSIPGIDIYIGENKWSIREDSIYLNDVAWGGGMSLVSGPDSNFIFTPITSGTNKGKYYIDVYYK